MAMIVLCAYQLIDCVTSSYLQYRENGGWGHISTDPRVFRGRTPGVPQKGDEKLQVSKVKLPATAAANRAAAAALSKTATSSSSAVEQKRGACFND